MPKFYFEIKPIWTQMVQAKNEKEAIEKLKDSMYEEYGIDIEDEEITKL